MPPPPVAALLLAPHGPVEPWPSPQLSASRVLHSLSVFSLDPPLPHLLASFAPPGCEPLASVSQSQHFFGSVHAQPQQLIMQVGDLLPESWLPYPNVREMLLVR